MTKYKIILDSNKIKRFRIFENKEENIFILDNGGLPFIVNLNDKKSIIYKQELNYNYKNIFTDTDENKNSSVLLELDDKYIFVGTEIYEFTTDDKIIDFKSPIGNSAVPYPVAIGKKNLYFMLDKVYINKEDLKPSEDYYKDFYNLDDDIKKHKFKNLKTIVKRT